jgi:Ca2+-binding EF-hand superfamily protein
MDNLTKEQKEEFKEAFSLFDYKEEDKISQGLRYSIASFWYSHDR